MKNLESGQTTLQKLEAYHPTWMAVKTRAQRGMVDTPHGRTVLDGELRESWVAAEQWMDSLLERYFTENAEVAFIQATADVDLVAPHEAV